jgi:hypothetical protein
VRFVAGWHVRHEVGSSSLQKSLYLGSAIERGSAVRSVLHRDGDVPIPSGLLGEWAEVLHPFTRGRTRTPSAVLRNEQQRSYPPYAGHVGAIVMLRALRSSRFRSMVSAGESPYGLQWDRRFRGFQDSRALPRIDDDGTHSDT